MLKFLLMLALSANTFASSIPLIGGTSGSSYIYEELNTKDYVQTLLLLKQNIDQQLIHGLSNQDHSRSWRLQKISIGLGVSGKIGIGPYKYGKSLKQRFIYSR